MKCKEAEVLITGYLDGELTQQDAQRVRLHIEECNHCSATYQELRQIKDTMGELSYTNADAEMLTSMEKDLLGNSGQALGWILLLVGILILGGFAFYEFFTTPEMPPVIRFGYGAIQLGMLTLFIVVLRQRLKTYRNDKYRKVKL